MKTAKLSDMKGGWMVGFFEPSLIKTRRFEVACKMYKKGDSEAAHYHLKAKEITLIANGEVIMNGKTYRSGDIVTIEKGEATDFSCVQDSTTVVIKVPSVPNDKFLVDSATVFLQCRSCGMAKVKQAFENKRTTCRECISHRSKVL